MKPPITLDEEQRRVLEQRAQSRTVSVRCRERALIVLAATNSGSESAIAADLCTTRHRVTRWRERFETGGVKALKKDRPRGGWLPRITLAKIKQIVELTTQTTPKHGTQWSACRMAERVGVGVSDTTVLRVCHGDGSKPHRVESFKLSNDPPFTKKIEDTVGLYMSPPELALLLYCDEKTPTESPWAIQALNRTQPGFPIKKSAPGR